MSSHRVPLEVPLTLNGRPVASETRLTSVGASVVVLETTLPGAELPVSLHSTYTGHPGSDTTAVHLLLAPGGESRTDVAVHDGDQLPIWAGRRHLVHDHLFAFAERLAPLGWIVRAETFTLALPALDA